VTPGTGRVAGLGPPGFNNPAAQRKQVLLFHEFSSWLPLSIALKITWPALAWIPVVGVIVQAAYNLVSMYHLL
jgi:hypothetical protein